MKVTFSALISNYSTSAVNLIEGMMIHDVIDVRESRGIREKNLSENRLGQLYFNNIKVTVNLQVIRKARSEAGDSRNNIRMVRLWFSSHVYKMPVPQRHRNAFDLFVLCKHIFSLSYLRSELAS